MTDIRCPECKKDDQVQKVSGIVAASTSFYSVTNLGVSLSPPDKPYLVRYPPTQPIQPIQPIQPALPTKSSVKLYGDDEPIIWWSGIIFGAVLGTGLCALLGFHFDLAPIVASLIVAILAGVGMGAIVQNGIKKSNLKQEIGRSKRASEQAMTKYQQDDLAYKKPNQNIWQRWLSPTACRRSMMQRCCVGTNSTTVIAMMEPSCPMAARSSFQEIRSDHFAASPDVLCSNIPPWCQELTAARPSATLASLTIN